MPIFTFFSIDNRLYYIIYNISLMSLMTYLKYVQEYNFFEI